jgi:hypothetical protein
MKAKALARTSERLERTAIYVLYKISCPYKTSVLKFYTSKRAGKNLMAEKNNFSRILPCDLQESFFMNSPHFITALADSGAVIFFNRAAEKATGFHSSQVIGKDFAAQFIPEEKRESFKKHFLEAGPAKKLLETFLCPINAKSSGTVYLGWTGFRPKNRKKNILLLTGTDMTENLRIISGLLAKIVHELNNSATFLLGNLPILKEAWKDIIPVLDKHYEDNPGFEVARLSYDFFRSDYPQVIEDMQAGCTRIRDFISRFKEVEELLHDKKK